MERGFYRKITKGMCKGCDYPAYCPSKKVNSRMACKKCLKYLTKHKMKGRNGNGRLQTENDK